MIKDTQTANLNKDKELQTVFPKSFEFICGTMGYKIEQFNLLLQKKCIQVRFLRLFLGKREREILFTVEVETSSYHVLGCGVATKYLK